MKKGVLPMNNHSQATRPVRVAIYTRKSVEDAEDKQFNSIDAQRAMCESFIAAKAAENWVALPERYDDYGYSGGDLNRPAYQRLVADCEKGMIDKVLVFRIDRLSRSVRDFADFDERMKELEVGFTSVSEPFVDTSSPMGELVMNMIVSFGQWERKTIAERIRKHCRTAIEQGFFVGGVAPYGYEVKDQVLVPDPKTAPHVPHIFKLYLETGSVKQTAAKLTEEGIERFPGRPWTMQSVHNLLRNVRYVGDANSQGKIVKGRQPALIPRDLWNKVQGRLKVVARDPGKRTANPETLLYQGLVFCGHCKKQMSYHWSRKDTLGIRKYGYFVCQQDMRQGVSTCPVRHVSVTTVQDTIERELESVLLASTTMLVAAANATTLTPEQIVTGLRRHTFWQNLTTADRRIIYRLFIHSITIFKDAIELRLRLPAPEVRKELVKEKYLAATPAPDAPVCIDDEGYLFVKMPVAFRTISGKKKICVTATSSPSVPPKDLAQGAILKAIAKSLAWMKMIDEGKVTSVSDLAAKVDLERHYVLHTLRLATLSPRIIRAALKGDLPDGFSLEKVRKVETDDWAEQEKLLGFKEVG